MAGKYVLVLDEVDEELEKCYFCPCRRQHDILDMCSVTLQMISGLNIHEKRPDWCPLVKVSNSNRVEYGSLLKEGYDVRRHSKSSEGGNKQ